MVPGGPWPLKSTHSEASPACFWVCVALGLGPGLWLVAIQVDHGGPADQYADHYSHGTHDR